MSDSQFIFIGTYTEPSLFVTGDTMHGRAKGIYAYRLDGASGAMELSALTGDVPNPSFLTFDPSRRYLYAVNELREYEGEATGAVSAFAINPADGSLTFLNRKPTHGTDPCHVAVDKEGKHVLVANFTSGSVCVLPIQADGSLGDASQFIQHESAGPGPRPMQSGPHAHAVLLDPSGRFALVPDLGLDRLMIYAYDAEQGRLEPHTQPWIKTAPGAGPRHVVLHPSGNYVYLINQLNGTMTAYQFDGERGTLEEIQTISTLPDDFEADNHCADVHVHPSGRFLYGSNRGHDSIVSYAIDPANGTLTYIEHTSTQGRTPRNFTITPDGALLLAANQDTDNVVAYRIDPATGHLEPTGAVTSVPTPVCLRIP